MLLVWSNFLFANFELPNSDVAVQNIFPVQRFDTENRSKLLEQVIGGVLPRVVGQGLRPKVDKVFEDEKFRRRTVEDDNGRYVVIVDH